MVIFGPKPWVNTIGKMSIFRLFELLVFIAWKVVFSFSVEYRKRRFSRPILHKKKVGKMAIFVQKPWVNPFEKMLFF